jgi:hypothetical protein
VGKNAKYPSQNLTKEEKEIIDQVIFRFGVKFYALIHKYTTPKEYAEKVVLKTFQSDKGIAALHTIAIARNETPDNLFEPRDINQKLAKDLAYTALGEGGPNRYLHPRDMTKVLKGLENEGIFLNITGKKEIRHLQHRLPHPGRKSSSDEDHNDLGGKPFGYKVTEEFAKLKKAMEKPQVLDLLHKKLIKTGLAYRLLKFNNLAFLHATKMDQTILPKIIRWGAAFTQDDLKQGENESSSFISFYEQLQLLDDNQLEQFAAVGAESLIGDRDYYKFFLSIAGLFKL